jgi:hypothetical protein
MSQRRWMAFCCPPPSGTLITVEQSRDVLGDHVAGIGGAARKNFACGSMESYAPFPSLTSVGGRPRRQGSSLRSDERAQDARP